MSRVWIWSMVGFPVGRNLDSLWLLCLVDQPQKLLLKTFCAIEKTENFAKLTKNNILLNLGRVEWGLSCLVARLWRRGQVIVESSSLFFGVFFQSLVALHQMVNSTRLNRNLDSFTFDPHCSLGECLCQFSKVRHVNECLTLDIHSLTLMIRFYMHRPLFCLNWEKPR